VANSRPQRAKPRGAARSKRAARKSRTLRVNLASTSRYVATTRWADRSAIGARKSASASDGASARGDLRTRNSGWRAAAVARCEGPRRRGEASAPSGVGLGAACSGRMPTAPEGGRNLPGQARTICTHGRTPAPPPAPRPDPGDEHPPRATLTNASSASRVFPYPARRMVTTARGRPRGAASAAPRAARAHPLVRRRPRQHHELSIEGGGSARLRAELVQVVDGFSSGPGKWLSGLAAELLQLGLVRPQVPRLRAVRRDVVMQ